MAWTENFYDLAGLTLYAYPAGDFQDATDRVLCIATGATDSEGFAEYTVTVNETIDDHWYVFVGATVPTDVMDKVGEIDVPTNVVVSPVITILPSTVRQAELQKGSKLRAYVSQRSPILGAVYSAANTPVDLSGRTLACKIATANEIAFTTIANADITVTGTDNNSFYFDPPSELVERARVFQWSLRDTADDSNLGSGELEIIYAP